MEDSEPTQRDAKRILIVEDNELNMKLLNDVLEAYGYEIIQARQGAAALPLAHQHRPDLILMDIQLPDMSGLEAVRRLRADEQTRAIPVIAVTAFAMAEDKERASRAGSSTSATLKFAGPLHCSILIPASVMPFPTVRPAA